VACHDIDYYLHRADALANQTATDDSVNPAGMDSVAASADWTIADATHERVKVRNMQGTNGNENQISLSHQIPALSITGKSLDILRRVLAVSLMMTAALMSATLVIASPVTLNQEISNQSINQADMKALAERANKLNLEGRYRESAAIWQQILTIVEKAGGPYHPAVGNILNILGLLQSDQRNYAEAEPLFRRSLAIREKVFGPNDLAVALTLSNIAKLLSDQGKYNSAEPLYRRSLTIRERAHGTDHPEITNSLDSLASLLSNQGRYKLAELLYVRSLAIREKSLGPAHPDVSTSLNNLAWIMSIQERYEEAEPLYRRSLAIREEFLGPNHPAVAVSLSNIGSLLSDQGKYSAAESFYRRSLGIREQSQGEDHPDTAISLNNLALLLSQQGQYGEATSLYQRSLAILEKTFGSDHLDVATGLNNLSVLLSDQGQYSEAESLSRRSLAIREKTLGLDHLDIATNLNSLAKIKTEQGQLQAAEPLYRRSLAIIKKNIGTKNSKFAISLGNLALTLYQDGQYSAAEPLYRKALIIHEETLGLDHPIVAIGLNNLASVLGSLGEYNKALPYFRRSMAIREKALGPDHIDVATQLANLASMLIQIEEYTEAIAALRASLNIQLNWLIRELPLLPDQVRSAQLSKIINIPEYVFASRNLNQLAPGLAMEARLNRQGLLPEIERRQTLLLNTRIVNRTKVEELQALTQRLASVSLPAEQRNAVRLKRDKLQAELYKQIPELQIQLVTPTALAKKLPNNGALVEFQRYRLFDVRMAYKQRWGAAQYIALILKPDGSITTVPLGAAASIDATIHKGLNSSAGALVDAEVIWGQLSDQVLKPLLPHLKDYRQWFLSPDGELNRVPFAALPAPQQPTSPLAKVVELRLLTTGRDLLRLQQPTPTGSRALVMANPNYDRPDAKAAPIPRVNANQRRSAVLGSSQWTPLPASEREGQQVARLLGTRLINGTGATTKALQRQHGPRVLHVATHGFFVADQESKPTEAMRSIQEDSPLLVSLRQEDPQLRSGLVLAGANQPDLDPNDDGYLTAAEAVTLNLNGTELVVLSACSTGQGEVRTGEGVYGLQRSLTVAGARSTLLSLWKVDDAATAEFMVRFYQRLRAGEGRSEALATVQQEFRSGKVKSPSGVNWKESFYWAAWQLVGDWRPIKGL
jgi:CHAT domain-containing protein/tetratricopeptide (TPR) repeat protein